MSQASLTSPERDSVKGWGEFNIPEKLESSNPRRIGRETRSRLSCQILKSPFQHLLDVSLSPSGLTQRSVWELGEVAALRRIQGRSSNSAFCLCHLLLFEIHSKGWTEDRVEVVLGFAWLSFFFLFFQPQIYFRWTSIFISQIMSSLILDDWNLRVVVIFIM